MSSSNQLPDAPDSTCGQVVHVKPEKRGNLWACITETKECQEHVGTPYDIYICVYNVDLSFTFLVCE